MTGCDRDPGPAARARGPLGPALAALAAGALATSAAAQLADIREGTNMALALSPDGATLVVDLLGGLWELPATGGGAVALLPAGTGVRAPRFSADGRSIVMQRWIDGQWDLWLLDVETREPRALTATPHDEREPEFSADGRSVLFAADRSGHFTLWSLDLGDGSLRELTDEPGDSASPAVAEDGSVVYVHRERGVDTLRLYSGGPRGTEIYRSGHWLASPSWRPGGRVVVFNEIEGVRASTLRMLLLADLPVLKELTHGEDVFIGRAAWPTPGEIVYAADGRIWRRGIGELTRTPLHMFAGVSLAAGEPPVVATPLDAPGPHRATGVVGAASARGGDITVFAALGDLWLADGRDLTQLTDDAFLDVYPSIDFAGESVVFVSDRGGTMDLWRLTLANQVVTQLTSDAGKPFAPALDPSGRRVAYLETEGFGPWSASALKLLDLARPYRPETLADSLYGARGLHWEPSGAALVLDAAAMRPGGPHERLRIVPGTSGVQSLAAGEDEAPRSPLIGERLPQWSPQRADAPYVVEVGRLFDGVRNDYLRHMDIHVEGQRIAAVVRRGTLPLPDTVIDAREATVYPGLVDVHVHQSVASGERLGRMWLVNGVTTIREIADVLPEALERAQSWASGRRLGPRLVVSPAAGSAREPKDDWPGGHVIVAGYPSLAVGLAHALAHERAQLGLPKLHARDALPEIAHLTAAPPAADWLRVSARNMSYEDTLAMMLASGTAVSTGLAAIAGAFAPPSAAGPAIAALLSPSERGRWIAGGRADEGVIAPLQDTLARIVRGGGGLAVASDAPAVPYGYGLHAELALLAEAGIPNDQVLRLASASGAIALGFGAQLGTLEAGKLADFVVVPGDPLRRIADAAAVTAVAKGGVWLTREQLLARPQR